MAIYYVDRCYKVEIITLVVKCPNCGLNQEFLEYSDRKEGRVYCDCCEHIIEIKIKVCSECNSSANIVELEPGVHKCKTCDKLVDEW